MAFLVLLGPHALRGGAKAPARARVSPVSGVRSRASEAACRDARDEPDRPAASLEVESDDSAAPRAG